MNEELALWNVLIEHTGHRVEIVGDGKEDTGELYSLCLECKDCGAVLLDAGAETITDRKSFLLNFRNMPYED